MQIKTRNGVFANQGYGGGTFNLNTAFGAIGETHMRQHQYRDTSNLNAPYDNMSLQGLGSLSGGPFGAVSLEDIPEDSDYPWMQEDDATLVLQRELNKSLRAEGMSPLIEDGILGPRTCGALNHYDGLDMVGGSCDSHAAEFIPPTPLAPPTVLPEEPAVVQAGVGGGIPPWMLGMFAASAAVGLALWWKKRKGTRVTLTAKR